MRRPQLLPQPKRIRIAEGAFSVPGRGIIVLVGGNGDRGFDIASRLKTQLFHGWEIRRAADSAGLRGDRVVLRTGVAKIRGREGYRLRIKKNSVEIDSATEAGLFYGIQTLIQIGRRYGAKLPALAIDDWPDFELRGVYMDMARGRVPKVEEVCRVIEKLATYKINHFELYVEHTFRFRKHPKIGKGASGYTAEDMLRIDEHARRHFVEFTPSIASFGHMSKILTIPDYRHLAEDEGRGRYHPDADIEAVAWMRYLHAWTLSPAVPAVYDFLGDLYGEFLPNFSSPRVNVCCDETWDLGMGKSRALCVRRGHGNVYLNHIKKVRKIAARHGKKILFWGDIILHYPELVREIPNDVTVLNWGYGANHDYSTCRTFQKAGIEQWVCPGTGSWGSLFPRIGNASLNISRFAEAGLKAGATGLLNTDWGDGGHHNFHDFSWHGYLLGADKSWNARSETRDFDSRFGLTFFGDETGRLGRAVRALGRAGEQSFLRGNSLFATTAFFAPFGDEVLGEVSASDAKRAVDAIAGARSVFEDFKKDGTAPSIMKQYIFAADTMEVAAKKIVAYHQTKRRPGRSAALRRSYLAEMRRLRKRFIDLWMSHSRRSEIRMTLDRYKRATGRK